MTRYVFTPDQRLLDKAKQQLHNRTGLFWLIGASCAGKSTVARLLAQRQGVDLYDMDEAVFGRYQFRADRHPATTAWFSAGDPLGFMLALSWAEFDALYRAANAEYLDLLADDLVARSADQVIILDGGITHPSLLAQVVPPARVACLSAPDAVRAQVWQSAPERTEMMGAIQAMPNRDAMWATFLQYDQRLAANLVDESLQCGIRVFDRADYPAADDLATAVGLHFGLEAIV
jgi:hypothetical protein